MSIVKLTHKLIELSGKSKLLKYPNSANKSGYKIDLEINLETILRLTGGDINSLKIILASY